MRSHELEAYQDALDMERDSIIVSDDDQSELPEHKRSYYMERMFSAADDRRKELREESL